MDISDLLSEQAVAVNDQLYPQSELKDSEIAKEYENSPHRLYNDTKPNFAIKHERPEHRMMVYMKAQGLSNGDIARHFGYTEPWTSQVLRQPWARKMLVDVLQTSGVEAVQGALQTSALDSVFKLIDLRDDPKAPYNVQANCAINILDRILGKPTQKIESSSTVTHVSQDVAEVEKELATIDAELARIGHTKNN